MLERWFPNLYGWLVWGGGFRLIYRLIIYTLILAFMVGLVALGAILF